MCFRQSRTTLLTKSTLNTEAKPRAPLLTQLGRPSWAGSRQDLGQVLNAVLDEFIEGFRGSNACDTVVFAASNRKWDFVRLLLTNSTTPILRIFGSKLVNAGRHILLGCCILLRLGRSEILCAYLSLQGWEASEVDVTFGVLMDRCGQGMKVRDGLDDLWRIVGKVPGDFEGGEII